MLKAPITNKQQMYEAYERLEFGNRLRYWPSVDDYWRDAGPPGCLMRQLTRTERALLTMKVGLRYRQAGSPFFAPSLYHYQVFPKMLEWEKQGCDWRMLTVSESSDPSILTLNGELTRDIGGLHLVYSTKKCPMRRALREAPMTAHGLSALLTLRHTLDDPSLDNMQRLLNDYPDHVIEFTSFTRSVGVLQNNTVIWEVRNY